MKCGKCKKEVSPYAKVCPYCGEPVISDQKRSDSYREKTYKKVNTAKKSKKKMAGVATVCVALVFVITLVYIFRFRDISIEGNDYLIYLKDDTIYARNIVTNEEHSIQEKLNINPSYMLSDAVKNGYYMNEEKGTLYYSANVSEGQGSTIYSIYKKNMNKWSTESNLIGQEIYTNLYSQDGCLYYATESSGYLYCYTGKTTEKVFLPVIKEMYYCKELDCILVVAYNTTESECSEEEGISSSFYNSSSRTVTIYKVNCKTFALEKGPEYLEDDVSITEDGKTAYYIKDDCLYTYELSTNETTLYKEQVCDKYLERVDGTSRLYYISYEIEQHPYTELCDDVLLKDDQKVEESKTLLQKETKEQLTKRKQRENFRAELSQTYFDLLKGTLHYVEEGQDVEVKDGVLSFVDFGLAHDYVLPVVLKQQEIAPVYTIDENAVLDMEDIDQSISKLQEQGSFERTEFIEYKSGEAERKDNVFVLESSTQYEVKKDGALVVGGNLDAQDKFDELLFEYYADYIKTKTSSDYNGDTICLQKNEIYYYDLMIDTDPTKTIAENVRAYKVLDDGSILYTQYDDSMEYFNVIKYNSNGTKETIVDTVDQVLGFIQQ